MQVIIVIIIVISMEIALIIVIVGSGILVMGVLIVVVVIELILIIIEVGVGMEVVLIIWERGEMLILERRVKSGTTDLRREVSWEASHVNIRREEHGWLNKHVLVPWGHHWVVEGEESIFIIFTVIIEFITFVLGLHDGGSLKETDVAATVLEEVLSP